MRAMILVIVSFLSTAAFAAPKAKVSPSNRLICKTGEKLSAGQGPKLYFTYNVPFMNEPEDPTMPMGRQVLLLAGRPVVQLLFERAPVAAGENGEQLQPSQCAFAKRAIKNGEPDRVQILLAPGQVGWISQPIGMRNPPRTLLTPPGDWAFASEPERIFTLDIDDTKNFVTSDLPVVDKD